MMVTEEANYGLLAILSSCVYQISIKPLIMMISPLLLQHSTTVEQFPNQ